MKNLIAIGIIILFSGIASAQTVTIAEKKQKVNEEITRCEKEIIEVQEHHHLEGRMELYNSEIAQANKSLAEAKSEMEVLKVEEIKEKEITKP